MDMLEAAIDSMMAQGILRASDIYFSIDESTRERVAGITHALGRYWAPGDRAGLIPSVLQCDPSLIHADVALCIRYGPIERLYGDLYMLLREYELLLWGLIRASLVARHGHERNQWWRKGVPEKTRMQLAMEQERCSASEPWELATFGSMQQIVNHPSNRASFARAFQLPDIKSVLADIRMVAEVRNSVMHPVRAIPVSERDFSNVMHAVHRLRGYAVAAKQRDSIAPEYLPEERLLVSAVGVYQPDLALLDT